MLKIVIFIISVLPLFFSFFNFLLFTFVFFFFFIFNWKFSCMEFILKVGMFICDNISFGFVLLTVFMTVYLVVSMMYLSSTLTSFYFIMYSVILFIFIIFSFMSSNIFIFYIFFESSLIPIYLIIMGWGYQPERLTASFYMLMYTILFSLPLMIVIFFIYNCEKSFNVIFLWHVIFLDWCYKDFLIWLSLIMAFMVKLPLFIYHIWLPKAHVEAPVGGSMILASVLLKLGLYGVYRVMFFFSYVYSLFTNFLLVFSLCGGLFSSFICLIQTDLKVLIAYSSVSHMGMSLSSLMTLSLYGSMGCYSMALAHGFCSSGLFYLSYCNYKRVSSRSFFLNKGILNNAPFLILFWFLFCVVNMSAPPFLTLFSEICMVISILSYSFFLMVILFLMLFFSCAYSLYVFSLISHGKLNSFNFSFSDSSLVENLLLFAHLLPLFILVMLMSMSLNL